MFCIYYQVHGAVDIQEKYFETQNDLDNWVKKHQESFSFCKASKEKLQ